MIAVYVSTSEIGGSMGNIDDVVRQTLRLRRDLCIVRWMGDAYVNELFSRS